MSILPRRFERIKSVLDCRMKNLTVLVEDVNKPHNLSAILRTCDAAGVYEANFISKTNAVKTFNSTCLLYTSPSPRDLSTSRMPSSA